MIAPTSESTRKPRNSEMVMISASNDEDVVVKRSQVDELLEILRRFSDSMEQETWAAIYGAAIVLLPEEARTEDETDETIEYAAGLIATDVEKKKKKK